MRIWSDDNRRYFLAGLAILLVILLSALVSRLQSREGIPILGGSRLVFTQTWKDSLPPETLEGLIRGFEEENPRIQVELKTLSKGEKIQIDAQLGDIFGMDAPPSGGDPGEMAPLLSFVRALFYNTALLRDAGLSRPPRTYQDFLEACRKISAENPQAYPFGLALGSPASPRSQIFPWIWSQGGSILKEGRFSMESPEAAQALDLLRTLYAEGLIKRDLLSRDGDSLARSFARGELGMALLSTRQEIFLQGAPISYGISALPGESGKPRISAETWYLAIPEDSPRKEEAARFRDYLKGHINVLLRSILAIPSSGLAPDMEEGLGRKIRDLYDNADILEEIERIPHLEQIEAIVREETLSMFRENRGGKETCRRIGEACQKKGLLP